MNTYDIILIGAGHNGLTAAAYLAKAGQKVLVLERRALVGGTVATEELWPGFKVDTVQQHGQIRPDIARDLNLAQHGLEPVAAVGSIFAPRPDGSHLYLAPNYTQATEAIARFSKTDAKHWPAFVSLMGKVANFLSDVYALTPPHLPKVDPAEGPALAQIGLKLRGLGKKDMMEVIRLVPMAALEMLDEWFESDAMRGVISAQAVHDLVQGPMGAGTVYNFSHHWVNHNGLFKTTPKGGVGQISQALAKAAQAFGAELRLNAEVAQINITDRRATGVTLKSGETFTARVIVANADPRHTLLGLVDPLELDPEAIHQAQQIKMRSATAKLHLALSGLPRFTAAPDANALRGTTVIAPSLNYVEKAYDATKYGECSAQPYLEVSLPTLTDPSRAPEGKHILSIHAQFAPYQLKHGDWQTQRDVLSKTILDTLQAYAPDLSSLITHSHLITPLDLEQTYGLTGGNLNHGEMMLDQFFFMRPMVGYTQYNTPIENLYLCGAGTHPGGGVSGASGRNAARQVLKMTR